ncbi:hepatitis A virus cellular receptor 1 homolog, partial [Neolamprologus brichardi]|uniref:hepatitis A virus cellular receptor 1 homolog n=1 Tax=Neolamprologus brichardi TaxID=32507 RepID=UPI001643BA7D
MASKLKNKRDTTKAPKVDPHPHPRQHRHISSSVRFNATSSTLQLHAQPAAVDNIYQMDGVCECDGVEVKGHTGQDVTLPCKYDRKYHGAVEVCWQRGEIPPNKCSNQLISTDGVRVETRAPSRYELLGRLEDGDVSLTIKNLTEGDAGRYGCRVEIPGPFNDEKHHIDLTVVP